VTGDAMGCDGDSSAVSETDSVDLVSRSSLGGFDIGEGPRTATEITKELAKTRKEFSDFWASGDRDDPSDVFKGKCLVDLIAFLKAELNHVLKQEENKQLAKNRKHGMRIAAAAKPKATMKVYKATKAAHTATMKVHKATKKAHTATKKVHKAMKKLHVKAMKKLHVKAMKKFHVKAMKKLHVKAMKKFRKAMKAK